MNCANHPEREKIAFCQNCGKPLCQECTRTVGSAVFCEPCLEARLAGASAPPPPGAGYASGNVSGVNFTTGPNGGSYTYTDPSTGYTASGPIPPPPPTGAPNPGLAAMLGFIPGVGAMYNGQYAKGIVHLIIFAILVSLSDQHDVFGIFVAGWVFYQVFEAYGTARARRDGTPLPNPFGLNDLGERLGFGKSWGTAPGGPVPVAGEPYAPPVNPYVAPSYAAPANPPNAYAPPAASAVPPQQPGWDAPWNSYAPPSANPYVVPPPAFDPNAPLPGARGRFPMGAIWLIGLGAVFLVGNAGILHGFAGRLMLPALLIGLGVWIFMHKMTSTGATLSDDGTAFYRVRLFGALRSSIWVILTGVMFLLANFHILGWGHSWPLFIIAAGLMTIFERTAFNPANAPAAYAAAPYPGPGGSVVPPSTPAEPSSQQNEEGR
ncbi:MAG: B-box zinc finger protein [Edaphobacter sp.]|uniref:B-box zinc finger protein n=1 Tax=Edaphobacter sp. TaxID=1934404 RepID=UPI002392CF6A|nr:B-box zinc finger protein [Edaphobacter sp.]MDE1178147.1 B-box zinc finger protein [Edaphobacter sp.]